MLILFLKKSEMKTLILVKVNTQGEHAIAILALTSPIGIYVPIRCALSLETKNAFVSLVTNLNMIKLISESNCLLQQQQQQCKLSIVQNRKHAFFLLPLFSSLVS